MRLTRRQLLTARLHGRDGETHAEEGKEDAGRPLLTELPPDFTPSLILAQAKMMKLDTENMSREELAKAVLDALNSQRPPEPEKPAGGEGRGA